MSNFREPRERKKYLKMNAEMLYKNFRGLEKGKNKAGDRNFCVYVDPEDAEPMARDGWNIKYQVSNNNPDIRRPFLPVAVSYKNFPPKIYIRNDGDRNEILLKESDIGQIDVAEIVRADVRVNPRFYIDDKTGETRIKGYLDELHVTIYSDEMDQMYHVIGDDDPPFDMN